MSDDAKTVAELEMLQVQRAQLASRLKTPWWYVVAMAFALAVACMMPIGSHYFVGAGIWCVVLAIAVFYLLQYALARVSGVALSTRTLKYPSGRPWGYALMVVILAACASESALLNRKETAAAVAIGVVATIAGTVCWQGHLRGVRRDLAAGREVM